MGAPRCGKEVGLDRHGTEKREEAWDGLPRLVGSISEGDVGGCRVGIARVGGGRDGF